MPVTLDLSGLTAWTTGAASGLGAAIADAFFAAGARVVRLDRAFSARELTRDGRDLRLPLDIGDRQAVATTARALEEDEMGADVLVNCAGITRDAISWRLTDADWDDVIDVNLSGAFRLVRAAAPAMRRRRSGAIVNIASVNGLRGKAGQANYSAAKGGLIALTRTLARELGPSGIRVNAVAPGMIDTPMTAGLPPEARARALAESALGRLGTPSDVAGAVLFLASPLARHITGHVLVVDGGQLA
jgi:3-oxoacyl-[acyl-carrier protein] reductase